MTLKANIVKARDYVKEGHIYNSIAILDTILNEMQDEEHALIVDVRAKVIEKLNQALKSDDPDGAYTLAQILKILSE